MRNFWNAYNYYGNKERVGLISLLSIILILASLRLGLPYLIKPRQLRPQEKALRAAWDSFRVRNDSFISVADRHYQKAK